MPEATRRAILTGAAGLSRPSGPAIAACGAVSGREVMRERYFPNVLLTTQEGRQVRFYDDLIKDKIVIIQLMFTNCGDICPLATANLAAVQKILGPRMGRDVFFNSISIKPEEDTPAELREYAVANQIGPGWTLLTGAPDDIELLRRRLGYVDPDPEVDQDKTRHSGMLRYGNETLSLWATCQASARPAFIADAISWVTRPKA